MGHQHGNATASKNILFLTLVSNLLLMSTPNPIGYLLWGTDFLYHKHNFHVSPNASAQNAPRFQSQHGFRGEQLIANLSQTVVESNPKIIDVEDATRSYKSPLSHW